MGHSLKIFLEHTKCSFPLTFTMSGFILISNWTFIALNLPLTEGDSKGQQHKTVNQIQFPETEKKLRGMPGDD